MASFRAMAVALYTRLRLSGVLREAVDVQRNHVREGRGNSTRGSLAVEVLVTMNTLSQMALSLYTYEHRHTWIRYC